MIPNWSSTAVAAHITYPPASLLNIFPPSSEPVALSPPQSDRTFARPFNISPQIYNELLNVEWPIVIATVYATTVFIINKGNRRRENKPWGISKSWIFYVFVLLHNMFLAAFSIWTFAGMTNAIRHTWPGFSGERKWAAAADALCKMHGPRGLGSAAVFNPSTTGWGFTDTSMKLLDSLPDDTDVGRLWNEGLGFYGWLFYVSKFYEVVDTFIVLAKGKNSSFLQTFHHAGAMMCMWAGIRYMSPPIWMFVFINSGLHGIMYVYYTLSTLDVRVPMAVKRTLTSLQIIQFVFGASYALAHLFVAYDIPVQVPYLFIHNLSSAIPSAASSVSSAVVSATASAGLQSWLKKAALRAAGEEGLAMNVRNDQGETFGIDAVHAAESEKAQEETRYRSEYQRINCLDTSGQVFAILLNAIYLAPLTLLFLRFFVNNYILGTKKSVPPSSRAEVAQQSAKDAIHSLEQEIKDVWEDETHNDEIEMPPEVKAKLDTAKNRLGNAKSKLDKATKESREKAKGKAEEFNDNLGPSFEAAQNEAKDIATKAKKEFSDAMDAIKAKAQNGAAKAQEKGAEIKDEAGKKYNEVKDRASGKAKDVKQDTEETGEKVKNEAEDTGEKVKDEAEDKAEGVKEKADDANNKPSNDNNTKDEPKSSTNTDTKDSEPKPSKPSSETPSLKPKSSKSKIPKRDRSPVKRDQSPAKRDQSPAKRDPSPAKSDPKPKVNGEDKENEKENEKEKDDGEGEGESEGKKENGTEDNDKGEGETNGNSLDESAYEINHDELKDEEEKEAEAEMQPEGVKP